MIDLKKIFDPLRKNWRCTVIFAVAFVFACWHSAYQIRSEWGGTAALLILLACLLYQAVKLSSSVPAARPGGFPWHKVYAWGLAAAALGCVFLAWKNAGASGFRFAAFFLLALGAVSLFCGVRAMLWGAVPLFGCFLIVPFREPIVLYLSYPFRMVSTVLSVGFLQMFGMKIENDMTTIRIEGLDIAITDACSGIQQFEAMILVAFWLVMVWRRPFIWRCVHYAFLVPSIILANAVRIILTIVLFKAGFESVLNNTWHEGLGYMQVVLTVAIFFLVGCLLPETEPAGKNADPGSVKGEGKKEAKSGKGGRS